MATASLSVNLEQDKWGKMSVSPYDLGSRFRTDYTQLFELIRVNELNKQLSKDFQSHQVSKQEDQQSLTYQIDSSLFHLYALLQIWLTK